jgi:hypothetical protein
LRKKFNTSVSITNTEKERMIALNFKLGHHKGKLVANVTIEGKEYTEDVTAFFEESKALDDWLLYRWQQTSEEDKQKMQNELESSLLKRTERAADEVSEYNKEMQDRITECYHSIHGLEPSAPIVLELAKKLPQGIHDLANQWGWRDTVLGDKLYTFIRAETLE